MRRDACAPSPAKASRILFSIGRIQAFGWHYAAVVNVVFQSLIKYNLDHVRLMIRLQANKYGYLEAWLPGIQYPRASQSMPFVDHLLAGVVARCRGKVFSEWPPRRESNPYLTLRRRVHYPLCYEEVGAYFTRGDGPPPVSFCRSVLTVLAPS